MENCYWCAGTGWVMVSTHSESGELIKWEIESCVCTKKGVPTVLNLDAMDAAIEAIEKHKKGERDGKKTKSNDVKKKIST